MLCLQYLLHFLQKRLAPKSTTAHHVDEEIHPVVPDAEEIPDTQATQPEADQEHRVVPAVAGTSHPYASAGWCPDYDTISFNPAAPRANDAPPCYERWTRVPTQEMSLREIYSTMKLISSLISRMGIEGDTIHKTAWKLLIQLQKLKRIPHTHMTLKTMLDFPVRVEGVSVDLRFYQYLYKYLHILVHDKEKENPRHKCTRQECQMYCMLPMFARRCISDEQV